MLPCGCALHPSTKRIVLTGGPGAGKTAVLELIRQRAAQRAIFFVQRELEASYDGGDAAVVLCDRGTIDGIAYWPGPDDLFASVGADRAIELGRYDVLRRELPACCRRHVVPEVDSEPEPLAPSRR